MLVLCVILILTTLGTVALAASALNASLSGKVTNWTKEYYTLDTQAERCVQLIDQQLITAENDARTYVQYRYDKKSAGELPSEFIDDTPYDMDSSAQAFFNKHYQETWTRDTTGGAIKITTEGAIEITLQDYIDDPDLMHERSASYSQDNSLTAEQAFSADVKKYNDELFDRIYFFMLSKRLTTLAGTVTSGAIAIQDREAPKTGPCTDKFTDFSSAAWDDMAPNDGDIKLDISVSNDRPDDPKEVKARISVVKPHYETILKTVSTPVCGNPVWTNAITASGSITFASGAAATIDGDVYASCADGVSAEDGIFAEDSSNVVIRGNIYTQGDLAITGNAGRLRVTSVATVPSGISYKLKKLIYGNDNFLDTKHFYDVTGIDPNLEKWNQFFFKDLADRGNVYCSSLLVSEGVQEAELKVDGNLWTKDDIQMDGRQSDISIGTSETIETSETSGSQVVPLTSYIGLNPFSDRNNPNASSSVINNFPSNDDGTPDSSITIDSNFVVPGVAFYEFSGGPEGYQEPSGGKYYYKSAESISARTTSPTAIISAYYYDNTPGTPYGTFKNSEGVDFDLITPVTEPGKESDEINKKKEALVNFFGAPSNIRTNITTDLTGPNGYVAGVALLQSGINSNAKLYKSDSSETASGTSSGIFLPGSTQYLGKYSELISANGGINALMAAFDSKTKQLGKAADGNFDDLLDTSVHTSSAGIIKPEIDPATGARILDLGDDPSAILEGIVYSEGNLTIRGNGIFKGTVICRGNVTVTGNPTVIYDESVIWGKLEMYKSVRDFFAKGNTDGVIGTLNDYSSTSGERTVLKRYKILSWQERSPAPGE